MRILIIEDDARLAQTLVDVISDQGDMADISLDGETGLYNAMTGIYDAIVLDIMLPGIDGLQVLRELRNEGLKTPVLMLSARSSIDDRVEGLNQGADYYLTKPFDNDELIACLHALMRRGPELIPETLEYGDITLVPSTCELKCGSLSIPLRSREMEILRLFIRNGQRSLSKEYILTKIWGYDNDVLDNSVESYVSFLRKKLNLRGSRVELVTVRKVGYHLEIKDKWLRK